MENNMKILICVIMEDAFKEAEDILEKAKRDAVLIGEQAVQMQKEVLRKNEREKNRLDIFFPKAKMVSKAELEARMEIMRQKESMLQKVLDIIRQELFSLSRNTDYPATLLKLINQGLQFLEGEEFTCQVNERDKSLLSSSLLDEINWKTGKKITLDEQCLKKNGGVFIKRRDGRVVYDNSLEAIFERRQEELRSAAAEYLFIGK